MRIDPRDRSMLGGFLPPARDRRARAKPSAVLFAAILTALFSTAVCVAAILTPAPPAAIPLVVLVSIGSPIFAVWEVPGALASLSSQRRGGRALTKLRRSLDQLPETEHPLGF